MKKILVLFIAAIMILASCGAPVETTAPVTDAPETDAPATEAPETEAPETEAPETEAPVTEAPETEAPETEAPETEAPETEAPKTEDDTKTMLFDLDFIAGEKNENSFDVVADKMDYAADGLKTNAANGYIFISDRQLKLVGSKTMIEVDVTFETLPHKADGVTNFPLSILSWVRKTSSTTLYDWTLKMDDQGTFYIKDTSTPTETKIEAGKRYTFGVLYDDTTHTAKIFLDGTLVGEKGYSAQTLTGSVIRIFDSGNDKAHFSATVHAARAYVAE